MARPKNIFKWGIAGGCLIWILGAMVTATFWGLVIAALLKYVVDP